MGMQGYKQKVQERGQVNTGHQTSDPDREVKGVPKPEPLSCTSQSQNHTKGDTGCNRKTSRQTAGNPLGENEIPLE